MNQATTIAAKKIGFVIKLRHPEADRLAVSLAKFALERGASVFFAEESRTAARRLEQLSRDLRGARSRIKVTAKKRLTEHVDLIVVLGGDGTYLSIARLIGRRSVPIMGINMGRLGFLTEIKQTEALNALGQILGGKPLPISERAVLDVKLQRGRKTLFHGMAVNDSVISKGTIARIVDLEVKVDGQPINTIRADGIIVCTPTGSTAYSLAAGGPILEPSVPGLIITAICAHSLTQRPLVIPDQSVVQIRLLERPGNVVLTLDGQGAIELRSGDVVTIQRSRKHSLKLISSPSRDYFSLLREKLKFGLRD